MAGHPAPVTTSTTVAHVHHFLPAPPHVPWGHVSLLLLALPFLALLLVANRRMNAAAPQKGGSGRVVGIVGRMGSGKSYMAVRMAIRRLKRGADVVTNFTMNLDGAELVNGLAARGWKAKQIAAEMTAHTAFFGGDPVTVGRVKVLRGITGKWRMFRGWDQFAELENAIVIIDEAHLYAPSNKSLTFPDVARFKMSQARKFHLDVYWVTQHEGRVNSILKDLTNMMFVSRSFMSGAWFSVKGYEPEHMRRKGKHLERQFYRLNVDVAGLYNTLEILAADDHLMKSESMAKAHKVAAGYNARQLKGSARDLAAAVHESAAAAVEGPGAIDLAPPPVLDASDSMGAVVIDISTATVTEPTARPAARPAPARKPSARKGARATATRAEPERRPRDRTCEHERKYRHAVGSCATCSPWKEPVMDGGRIIGWV